MYILPIHLHILPLGPSLCFRSAYVHSSSYFGAMFAKPFCVPENEQARGGLQVPQKRAGDKISAGEHERKDLTNKSSKL